MISRRLIRIKVLQILYSHFKVEDKSIQQSERELFFSINKTYDLYHLLLLLLIDLARFSERKVETALNRLVPSYDDLHPNTRFIDNKVILQLVNNTALTRYLQEQKLNWTKHPDLIKNLFIHISNSEHFIKYMNSEVNNYDWDKEILIEILQKDLPVYEGLDQTLEEESIFWNDDIDFALIMALKTIEKFKDNALHNELLPLYKNDEDKEFAKTLFRKTLFNHKEYNEMIIKQASNWDLDRIAQMDILIMQLAISECIEFPSIPTKVTLNEFIEISKEYSTDKSNVFINGLLDKIIIQLKNDKKIIKTGRGLIGEN